MQNYNYDDYRRETISIEAFAQIDPVLNELQHLKDFVANIQNTIHLMEDEIAQSCRVDLGLPENIGLEYNHNTGEVWYNETEAAEARSGGVPPALFDPLSSAYADLPNNVVHISKRKKGAYKCQV